MENNETLKSKFGFWLEQVGEGATSYWLVYGTTTLDGKPRPASDEEIILWESALSAQGDGTPKCTHCNRAANMHYCCINDYNTDRFSPTQRESLCESKCSARCFFRAEHPCVLLEGHELPHKFGCETILEG